MKVASYNIHKCRGLDGVTRPDRIIGVIRELGADVIALQEVDRRFGRRSGLLDPSALERETGMRLLGQSDVSHRHGWHGNALLVRGEPISYRRSRLKLPGGEPRGAIVAELDLGEGEFRVIAAHLGLLRLSRVDQISALLTAFHVLPPMPTILLGDFNEWRRRRRSSLRGLEADLRRRAVDSELSVPPAHVRARPDSRLAGRHDHGSRGSRHPARPTSLRSFAADRHGELAGGGAGGAGSATRGVRPAC